MLKLSLKQEARGCFEGGAGEQQDMNYKEVCKLLFKGEFISNARSMACSRHASVYFGCNISAGDNIIWRIRISHKMVHFALS
jgi:hypothetical protein